MDRSDVGGGLHDDIAERRGEVLLLALDDEALGAKASVLGAAGETGEQLSGGVALRCLRDGAGLVPDDAVDATAGMVAQVVLMRAADTRLGIETAAVHAGGRIVLDDEVLPVGEPDGAVGTDFGEDRRHPFVGAGHEAVAVLGDVTGPGGLHVHEADELHRRLADHGLALQARGQLGGVDEGRAGGGGVAAHDVDLTEVGGDRMGLVDDVDLLGRHAAGALSPRGRGDAAEEDRGVVGGTTEGVAGGVGAIAPCVVRELVEKLESGAVRGEAIAAHGEVLLLAADLAGETAVADRATEPVVVTVGEAAGLGVGVADAPAGQHDLTDVGLVVAVGILEEDEVRGLSDDHAAVHEDEARRDVEMVGEDRELVGLAVAVGVFADLDAVIALLLVFLHAMRVIRGLADPEAAARVPRERDRLHDVGFGSEEHQLHVGRHLGSLHAALDGERFLEGQRLGALLVVGDLGVLLADFGFALSQELLPAGLAGRRKRGLEFGAESGRRRVGLDVEDRDHRAVRQLDRGIERRRTIGLRLHREGVEALERRGVRSGARGVVEPDGVAAEFGHQGVERADRGLLVAGGVQIQDADGTVGRRGEGHGGKEQGKESDREAHRGMEQAKPRQVRKQSAVSSKNGHSPPLRRESCRKNESALPIRPTRHKKTAPWWAPSFGAIAQRPQWSWWSFAAGLLSSGRSVMRHSVVSSRPATDAALVIAVRVTLVGSTTPALMRSSYSPVATL